MNLPRVILAVTLLASFLSSCTGAPHYRGPQSDHFNGREFVNRTPMDKGAGDIFGLGWGSLTQAERWPEWVDIEQQAVSQERVQDGLSITLINHASFLIQVDGLNILTDPVYSERVSPFRWAGPRRVHAPGVAFSDLPPIDVVLISHNHYDHLDAVTLQQLYELPGPKPLLLAGLGNGAYFERLGLENFHDLDWEQGKQLNEVEFIFSECRHRSGRGISDQMKTLWGAFVIKTSRGNIYFGGDSGYDTHFKATGDQHGPFALSLLPIGAYEPRWFMKDVHVNPTEAVQAHIDLRSDLSVGMHFGTFQLTYEAIDQPEIDLGEAMKAQDIAAEEFRLIKPGDSLRL